MEPQAYVFGPFRIDIPARQLFRDGTPVALPSKAFDTLLHLVRNHDRAVPKDELIKAVWPDTFVSDDSLTQSISLVRRAIGDPEAIATIPRRGYRFIVPVVALGAEGAAPVSPVPAAPVAAAVGAVPAASLRAPRRSWTLPRTGLVLAALLAALVVAGLIWRPLRDERPPAALRFTQEAPPGTSIVSGGVLSPDGRMIAFVAEDVQSGTSQIWVRELATAAARALPGTGSALRPFWSPDSQALGFIANGRLKTIALSGGTPRNLAAVRNNYAGGAAWGADRIVFANWRAGLDSVAPTGGAVTPVTRLDASAGDVTHQWPQFLPDGRHLLFEIASGRPERSGIYVAALDGSAPVRLLDGSHQAPVPSPSGHLLFVRDNVLLAQPFDLGARRLLGAPATVAENVSAPSIRNSATISAAEGALMAFGGGTSPRRLAWFNRRGERLGTIDAPTTLTNPTLSIDEKQLLAVSFDADARGVWLLDLERGAPNRVITDGTLPMPSPAGDTIAFASSRQGVSDIYLRRLGGRSEDEPLLQTSEAKFINDWSRDGRFIIFGSSNAQTGEDLWLLPTFGDRRPVPYLQTPDNEIQSRVSPDGRWVAYTSDESGMLDVYVQSFPVAGAKEIVSIRGGAEPAWRGDGRELFYISADRTLMAVDVTRAGDTLRVSRPRALFRPPVLGPLNVYRSHYAVTADGERFVIDVVEGAAGKESITLLANSPALLAD